MKNKKVVIAFILAAIFLFAAAFFLIKGKGTKKEAAPEAKKVEEIKVKEFAYELYDNKSDLYKSYFAKLKEELTKDQVNEEEYAKLVAQLFVTDFYSLADKKTNTDIGGLDFIYPDKKDNFVLKAQDKYYKYVETNVYGDRTQELPKIKQVDIVSATNGVVTVGDVSDPLGYTVVATITYEKDLGYPTQVTLTMVHVEKKLFIVEVK